MALITALLAILALLSLSVLFVAMTTTENRVTGDAKAFEAAIHVAEGATDHVIAEVNRSPEGSYDSGVQYLHNWDGTEFTCPSGSTTEQCESAWIVSLAKSEDRPASAPIVTSEAGQGFAVRPHAGDTDNDGVDEPLSLIFGLGVVPGYHELDGTIAADTPVKTRVVRLQFDQRSYNPRHAILACGNLHMGGNASINDVSEGAKAGEGNADVHANGDVTTTGGGGSVSVDGTISATGTVQVSDSSATGGTEGDALEQECPDVSARDFYSRHPHPRPEDTWWDLCPDGVMRQPDDGGVPCANDVGSHDTLTQGPHLGWSFDTASRIWSANAVHDGVFYVYQGTVKLSGIDKSDGATKRKVTIIAEADPASTTGTSGSSCKSGNVNTGNICLSGNPKLEPALTDTLLVADRDVDLAGTSGTELAGFVFAGEQIEASGTVKLTGAMIAEDNPDTPRSPIKKTGITGTLNLDFQAGLQIPLTGIVRVTAWNEIQD
ncbi:MAG: hypothetical protein R3320_04655 [Nitriliruptorales bacterium]|nr:hypothetical protein [Nitriliruptorales bacterium]